MKKPKLSKAQKKVLLLMREGWSLCSSSGYRSNSWLQEKGCGKGGRTEKVNFNTFFAIRKQGMIDLSGERYPTTSYVISDHGLEALRNEGEE